MVELVDHDHPELRRVKGDPAIAAVIEASAQVCGRGIRRDFWLVRDAAGDPAGAICQGWAGLWATVSSPASAAEAAEFVRFLGAAPVQTDALLAPWLGTPSRVCRVMSYAGESPERQPLCPPDVMALLELNIQAGALPAAAREELYSELHLRLRRGAARVFLVPGEDGSPAAGAALSFLGGTHGVVGYLACRPREQGRGLAAAAVRAAVLGARELGLVPILICEPSLEPFYRHLGWQPVGEEMIFSSL